MFNNGMSKKGRSSKQKAYKDGSQQQQQQQQRQQQQQHAPSGPDDSKATACVILSKGVADEASMRAQALQWYTRFKELMDSDRLQIMTQLVQDDTPFIPPAFTAAIDNLRYACQLAWAIPGNNCLTKVSASAGTGANTGAGDPTLGAQAQPPQQAQQAQQQQPLPPQQAQQAQAQAQARARAQARAQAQVRAQAQAAQAGQAGQTQARSTTASTTSRTTRATSTQSQSQSQSQAGRGAGTPALPAIGGGKKSRNKSKSKDSKQQGQGKQGHRWGLPPGIDVRMLACVMLQEDRGTRTKLDSHERALKWYRKFRSLFDPIHADLRGLVDAGRAQGVIPPLFWQALQNMLYVIELVRGSNGCLVVTEARVRHLRGELQQDGRDARLYQGSPDSTNSDVLVPEAQYDSQLQDLLAANTLKYGLGGRDNASLRDLLWLHNPTLRQRAQERVFHKKAAERVPQRIEYVFGTSDPPFFAATYHSLDTDVLEPAVISFRLRADGTMDILHDDTDAKFAERLAARPSARRIALAYNPDSDTMVNLLHPSSFTGDD